MSLHNLLRSSELCKKSVTGYILAKAEKEERAMRPGRGHAKGQCLGFWLIVSWIWAYGHTGERSSSFFRKSAMIDEES
jgi:hypothetical protein